MVSSFIKPALIILFLTSLSFLYAQNNQKNVVLHGDFADPTIVRDGNTFYMTQSSYDYYPGLLIWKSTDLVKWTPVTRALNTNCGNVWAPDFVKYKDKFYIYFPTDKGGNYVITADKPEGPWSEPVKINIDGIDPGHIAAPDGQRYLYVNGGRAAELSPDGLKIVGDIKDVYSGWQYPLEWGTECFCLESPKLTYRNGYYYLTSAEGGTSGPATSHMAVVARSTSPLGPWENSPYNPLIKTWKGSEPWVSKGHATIFADGDNNWFAVYHAYERGNLPLGRSTIIEPVEWTDDGWCKVKNNELNYKIINNNKIEPDDFSGSTLKLQWSFSGLDNLTEYKLENGALRLEAVPNKMRVLQAITGDYAYETSVKIEAGKGVETGLLVYYNQSAFAGIALKDGKVFSYSKGKKHWGGEFKAPECRYLKLKMDYYTVSMSYSSDGINWKPYDVALDVSGYQTNMLGGFSSLKVGIFCRGEGPVLIDDFKYKVIE